MRPLPAQFTIDEDGRKTFVHRQLVGLSCPTGHQKFAGGKKGTTRRAIINIGAFAYKTRVPAQDLQVHCPHCGKIMLATQRGGA